MKKIYLIFLLSILFTNGFSETIRWTGCGITKKAFMHQASRKYDSIYDVKILLTGGGASKGLRKSSSGETDLGGSCRPPLPQKFSKSESDVMVTVVAWDAIVPIINNKNPVSDITINKIKEVMTGKITDWGDLGGPAGKKIELIIRKGQSSGVGFVSRQILFNFKEKDIKEGGTFPFSKSSKKMKSSGPLENYIQHNQWSFGLTGISSAKKKNVKILKINGIKASVENIANGSYLFFRPLYLATKGVPKGKQKKFIDWIMSPAGQEVIESQGTVSLRKGKGLKEKYKFWIHTDKILNYEYL